MPRDLTGDVNEAHIESEIARIRSLSKDALRFEWQNAFCKEVPKALTRDLLARMLIWRLQERAYGGFDRVTLKLLESYARAKSGDAERFRRLKPGTEIIREHQGQRHTVMILREGFVRRGTIYPSLTTIARLITGTSWNGPRSFGLRLSSRTFSLSGGVGGAGLFRAHKPRQSR